MIPNHINGSRNEVYSTSETNVILESRITHSPLTHNPITQQHAYNTTCGVASTGWPLALFFQQNNSLTH